MLHETASVLFGFSVGTVVVSLLIFIIVHLDNSEDRQLKISANILKYALIATFILIIFKIFTPSENRLYMIYGIGETIDYIKSNESAKQLPDKTIKTLDSWLDSLSEENRGEKQE